MEKKKVGILGATGMVGQRLVCLLENHPFFEVNLLLAGEKSAGKTYQTAVEGRWKMTCPIPDYVRNMRVRSLENETFSLKKQVDLVFSAVSLPKNETKILEESLAKEELVVVSCNSACRGERDVPMLLPEINIGHLAVLEQQKKRLATKRGYIVTKPNCSIQSFVPPLTPLLGFGIEGVAVATYQAVSGTGKTFSEMPEITDNLIPYISGEEEKTETEPLKIWGSATKEGIVSAPSPRITAQCIRVPVSDGHTAAVFVKFRTKPTIAQILSLWEKEEGIENFAYLPTAPEKFLTYTPAPDRPQPQKDRMREKGMGITLGRLREDAFFDYKFVCLSHNTLRGAGGGAVLTAEYLYQLEYL